MLKFKIIKTVVVKIKILKNNAAVQDDLSGAIPPQEWNWEMSAEDRWIQCDLLEKKYWILMSRFDENLRIEQELAKAEHHEAKIKASTRVYEDKEVIGGTIVGCIKRLEAIKYVLKI
jgi:hypothetical protein